MEVGFLRDRSYGTTSETAEWMGGFPERNWAGGLKIGSTARFAVQAFRCEKCGFLEQYAVGEPKATIFGS
jgi:hypothetical protein